jgi:hypothetical protein
MLVIEDQRHRIRTNREQLWKGPRFTVAPTEEEDGGGGRRRRQRRRGEEADGGGGGEEGEEKTEEEKKKYSRFHNFLRTAIISLNYIIKLNFVMETCFFNRNYTLSTSKKTLLRLSSVLFR